MIREAMMKLREVLFGRGGSRSDELEAALAHRESSAILRRRAVDEARRAIKQHAVGWTIDEQMASPLGDGEGR